VPYILLFAIFGTYVFNFFFFFIIVYSKTDFVSHHSINKSDLLVYTVRDLCWTNELLLY